MTKQERLSILEQHIEMLIKALRVIKRGDKTRDLCRVSVALNEVTELLDSVKHHHRMLADLDSYLERGPSVGGEGG